jgi:hypothetical protein
MSHSLDKCVADEVLADLAVAVEEFIADPTEEGETATVQAYWRASRILKSRLPDELLEVKYHRCVSGSHTFGGHHVGTVPQPKFCRGCGIKYWRHRLSPPPPSEDRSRCLDCGGSASGVEPGHGYSY